MNQGHKRRKRPQGVDPNKAVSKGLPSSKKWIWKFIQFEQSGIVVKRRVKIEVEVLGPIQAAKDVKLFFTINPKTHEPHYIDESGGMLGNDIKRVLDTIKRSHWRVLKNSLIESSKHLQEANEVTPKRFWGKK